MGFYQKFPILRPIKRTKMALLNRKSRVQLLYYCNQKVTVECAQLTMLRTVLTRNPNIWWKVRLCEKLVFQIHQDPVKNYQDRDLNEEISSVTSENNKRLFAECFNVRSHNFSLYESKIMIFQSIMTNIFKTLKWKSYSWLPKNTLLFPKVWNLNLSRFQTKEVLRMFNIFSN